MHSEISTASDTNEPRTGNGAVTDPDRTTSGAQDDANSSSRVNAALRFVEGTSLPGVPHVLSARSPVSRMFWVLVCIVCATMFIWGVSDLLATYFSYPKKVTVELVSEPVPFPSVTLCNMRSLDLNVLNRINQLFLEDDTAQSFTNRSFDNEYIDIYMGYARSLATLYYSNRSMSDVNVSSALQEAVSRTAFTSVIPDDVIAAAGIKLDQFIATCTFGGVACDMSRDFVRHFDSYYYNCYTYRDPVSSGVRFDSTVNSASSHNGNPINAMPWLSPGLDNGLSMVALTGSGMVTRNQEPRKIPGMYDPASATSGSDGVRVIVHSPDVQPFPLAEGFDVPPGFSASFGIRPRRNVRIGPPHGDCIDRSPLRAAAPADGSTKRAEDQQYRQLACQQMCMQQQIIDKCGCYVETLPSVYHADELSSCYRLDLPDGCQQRIDSECFDALLGQYERIQCSRRVRNEVRSSRTAMEKCGCRAACNELLYDVSYSVSGWPAPGFEADAVFLDIFGHKSFYQKFEGQQLLNYVLKDRSNAMRDFARINIYVADPEVMVTRESPEYDVPRLISDIGGQLGVWIGLSLMTIAEVVELVGQVITKLIAVKCHLPGSADDKC